MIQHAGLPRLNANNHRVTSPASKDYNCIAWAMGDTLHWWEPDRYWPIPIPDGDYGIGVLEVLFRVQGYTDCGVDARLEPGYENVALYGSTQFYTHAAHQLASGKWTSKLGKWMDIEHDTPEDVAGGTYGDLFQVMKRLLPQASAPK